MLGNPWKLRKVVLPQHTDHAGVMWHGTYLNWLEEARIDALSKVGISYGALSKEGYEMPVVSLTINYFKPILHGNEVFLDSWLMERKGARWPWKTNFSNLEGDKMAQANVDLVFIKRSSSGLRVVKQIPKIFIEAFSRLQTPSNL